jgi:hypothetical protein
MRLSMSVSDVSEELTIDPKYFGSFLKALKVGVLIFWPRHLKRRSAAIPVGPMPTGKCMASVFETAVPGPLCAFRPNLRKWLKVQGVLVTVSSLVSMKNEDGKVVREGRNKELKGRSKLLQLRYSLPFCGAMELNSHKKVESRDFLRVAFIEACSDAKIPT